MVSFIGPRHILQNINIRITFQIYLKNLCNTEVLTWIQYEYAFQAEHMRINLWLAKFLQN